MTCWKPTTIDSVDYHRVLASHTNGKKRKYKSIASPSHHLHHQPHQGILIVTLLRKVAKLKTVFTVDTPIRHTYVPLLLTTSTVQYYQYSGTSEGTYWGLLIRRVSSFPRWICTKEQIRNELTLKSVQTDLKDLCY